MPVSAWLYYFIQIFLQFSVFRSVDAGYNYYYPYFFSKLMKAFCLRGLYILMEKQAISRADELKLRQAARCICFFL